MSYGNNYGNPPGTYGAPPGQQYGQQQYGAPPGGQYGAPMGGPSPSDFMPQPSLAPSYSTQYPGSQPMAPPPAPAPQQQYPPQQQYGAPPQQPYGGPPQQQQQYGQSQYGSGYGQQGLAPPASGPPQHQPPPQYAPPPQQHQYPQQPQHYQPPPQYAQRPQQHTSVTHVHHHAPRPAVVAAPAAIVVQPIMYNMQLGCVGLDRKDVFSKSDPFLILSAKRNPAAISSQYKTQHSGGNTMVTGDWIVCHKTETIMNNHKPVFKPFQIDLRTLCNGNMDQPFLVECFDWDANSRHDFIGSVQTTIRECQIMKEMHLRNPKRKAVSKIAGQLNILRLEPMAGGVAAQAGPTMVGGAPAGGY